MMSEMSAFTEKEILALQEFRKRVSDVLPNDDFAQRDDSLIRWIRAREMNLDKAEDMIRNSMKWRSENKIDKLLGAELDPALSVNFPYFLDGLDKKGRPVMTMPYGTWDIRSYVESEGNITKFTEYMNQMLEKVVASIKQRTYENEKNGNDDDETSCVQFVAISDMSGYSYRQLANIKTVQSLIQTVSIYEAHHPEILAHCFIINAPTIFSILFGMIKPFMSGKTLDKIKIFSSDKSQWLPAVLEVIDKEQIREAFGGTKI